MADKKVRITEELLSDYTGHMFGVQLEHSVTTSPVSEARQKRMLAALRGEVVEVAAAATTSAPKAATNADAGTE